MSKRDLGAALEERGYTVLFSVGFGERTDGVYSIKVAAHPAVRQLSGQTWQVMRQTMVDAIDKLMASPFDDLEIEH